MYFRSRNATAILDIFKEHFKIFDPNTASISWMAGRKKSFGVGENARKLIPLKELLMLLNNTWKSNVYWISIFVSSKTLKNQRANATLVRLNIRPKSLSSLLWNPLQIRFACDIILGMNRYQSKLFLWISQCDARSAWYRFRWFYQVIYFQVSFSIIHNFIKQQEDALTLLYQTRMIIFPTRSKILEML